MNIIADRLAIREGRFTNGKYLKYSKGNFPDDNEYLLIIRKVLIDNQVEIIESKERMAKSIDIFFVDFLGKLVSVVELQTMPS
uniref:Uncharacterized protein n=1 Tax=candidate division CPR3 bacterium TaxID=2268181 RepID=A0A7V3JAJ2_UNCC3